MTNIVTKAQHDAQHFMRYAFGEQAVGSADNEAVERAYSPELRAFFQGRLGAIPVYWYYGEVQLTRYPNEITARKSVGEFLREIADILDPITEDLTIEDRPD